MDATYIQKVHTLNERVARVLADWDSDPEESHREEDHLLEIVIRDLAHTSLLAQTLLPLLDRDRVKWYA